MPSGPYYLFCLEHRPPGAVLVDDHTLLVLDHTLALEDRRLVHLDHTVDKACNKAEDCRVL